MNNFWQKSNKPIYALAPLAGFTDSAFRQICKDFGVDVVYSEMASVNALKFKPEPTLELETPFVAVRPKDWISGVWRMEPCAPFPNMPWRSRDRCGLAA